MSFIIVPSNTYDQRSAASPSFGRCGPGLFPFNNHRNSNAIPRDLLGALFEQDDHDVIFNEAACLTPWQELHLEQLRRQEYLEEIERRRRIQVARQKQLELERRVVLARREKEKAARLAWHQEQQRKAALAHEYRRRLEAHKRRQEEEYAQQVRLAQEARLARQAEQARPEPREVDWEHLATQSIFGVLDLVQHLFGDEQHKSTSKVDGKKREKTTEEVNAEQAKHSQVEKPKQDVVEAMQVDDQDASIDRQSKVEAEVEKAVDAQDKQVAAQTQEEQSNVDAREDQVKAAAHEGEANTGHLVFTYPLPQDEAARSSIKAQDIGVSYDEESHTVQLTGLWSNDSAGTSSSSHEEENQGRSRSRSPKRSRVSDVDEKTGEEIIQTDANDEGFVQVAKAQTSTKSIRLPQDATVTNLRAELTDDGFKVFV